MWYVALVHYYTEVQNKLVNHVKQVSLVWSVSEVYVYIVAQCNIPLGMLQFEGMGRGPLGLVIRTPNPIE